MSDKKGKPKKLNLTNDNVTITEEDSEIWLESSDSWFCIKHHDFIAKEITRTFTEETTMGDVIFLVQSLGVMLKVKYI